MVDPPLPAEHVHVRVHVVVVEEVLEGTADDVHEGELLVVVLVVVAVVVVVVVVVVMVVVVVVVVGGQSKKVILACWL